jgi:hypothetical protein
MAKSNGSYIRQIAYTNSVTPSDGADLPGGVTRGLLVAAEGDVAVTYANGQSDTIFLTAGMFHPVAVARVKSTGTTATGIKAGY